MMEELLVGVAARQQEQQLLKSQTNNKLFFSPNGNGGGSFEDSGDMGGEGPYSLDPSVYFADPMKAHDRPVVFDADFLGLAVEECVGGHSPRELWMSLTA